MTYYFLSRCLYICHSLTDKTKLKESNSSSTFEGFYLNLRREFSKFRNTVDSRLLEHSENGTLHKHLLKSFHKLNSFTSRFNQSINWQRFIFRNSETHFREQILCVILRIALFPFIFWFIENQLYLISFLHSII